MKITAPQGVACTDGLGDFKPSLRNTWMNTWEATICLPVVGNVTAEGNGWQEAKMRLWIISEAVKMFAATPCADPRDWTEEQWRATLKTMRDLTSPNEKVSNPDAENQKP